MAPLAKTSETAKRGVSVTRTATHNTSNSSSVSSSRQPIPSQSRLPTPRSQPSAPAANAAQKKPLPSSSAPVAKKATLNVTTKKGNADVNAQPAAAVPSTTPPPLFQTAEEAESALKEEQMQLALHRDIQLSLMEDLRKTYQSVVVQSVDQVLQSLVDYKERETGVREAAAAARQANAALVATAKARLSSLQAKVMECEATRDAAMLVAKTADNQRSQMEENCTLVRLDIQEAKQCLTSSQDRQKRMREEVDKHEGELLAIREGKQRTMDSLDALRARVERGQQEEAAAAAALNERQQVIKQLEANVAHLQKLQRRKPGQPLTR